MSENIFSSLDSVHLRILKVIALARPRWVKTKEFDGKVGVDTRSAILKKTQDLLEMEIILRQYEPNTEARSRRPYVYKIAPTHIDSVDRITKDIFLLNQEKHKKPSPQLSVRETNLLSLLEQELESTELELKAHQESYDSAMEKVRCLQQALDEKQAVISRLEEIVEHQKALIHNYKELSQKD